MAPLHTDTSYYETQAIILFVGDSKFASAEYRLFKVKSQSGKSSEVTYKGGIPGAENEFKFDNQWKFKVGVYVNWKQTKFLTISL